MMSETAMVETTSNKATAPKILNGQSGEDVEEAFDSEFKRDDFVLRAKPLLNKLLSQENDENDGNPAINTFATRKKFVLSCFDAGLFMANSSQLKAVIDLGSDVNKQYRFILLITLISLSLLLQIIFGVLMLVKWKLEKDLEQKTICVRKSGTPHCNVKTRSIGKTIDNVDFISLVLVFLSALINITITAFGLTSK